MPRLAADSETSAEAASTSDTRSSAKDSRPPPSQIGAYRVDGELGRGGMARVYRVTEDGSGRQFALKQLDVSEDLKHRAAELIEREFHTLAQLSHPSVIEVYDYGIAERGPYYTMELLDGGDLRTRSPIPWREVCEVAFDVCSSLALLHSRRLVHRDITPRNVRCTLAGRAKLIDFGAMAPMGPGGNVIGTPAFIAPEVVHRSTVDGRADLFSLGATMYFALTRRAPYAARELSQVLEAWRATPVAPSLLAADIPPELDLLVMSMLSVEPALRPRGAHEVMERLHVIAGVERDEALDVSLAYLATPVMVGREESLVAFRRAMERASNWRGGALMVQAGAGLGRSRLLDAFALGAKLLGATSLRASADSERKGNLEVARALVEQLGEQHPASAQACARELDPRGTILLLRSAAADADADGGGAAPSSLALCAYPEAPAAQLALQTTLSQWFLRVSRQHALLIAVDDVDRIDEPSAALLAALAHNVRRNRLLLAVTCEQVVAAGAAALDLLAQQCTRVPLGPLDQAETETLLGSVFGDVPNIALLADRVHTVALGRPRDCMAIARDLVERGVIKYAAGNWTLPEQLETADLPRRAQDVLRARVAALRPLARTLACLHAHALVDSFTREDYVRLNPAAAAGDIDGAINELLSQELLRSDGRTYALAQRELRELLKEGLSQSAGMELHRMLAELAERNGKRIEAVSHLLSAGLPDRAIDSLFEVFAQVGDPQGLATLSLPFHEIALVIERALDATEATQRKPREVFELLRWLMQSSVAADDRLHARSGPLILAQLERDSGLALWRQLADVTDPGQRLMQALQRTGEVYAATPEAERVYRIDEALTHLVFYVVVSIAVGARAFDGALIASLPGLLEPFVALSPAIAAMWKNAIATLEITTGRPEQAYERWRALYEELEHVDPTQLKSVDLIRSAIAYALGAIDAQIGRDSVGRWTEILDKDPLQQVNAMYLRRVLCLHRGDLQSAERFRHKAEVLAVQATTRQMFSTASVVELSIAAMTRDLTGVKHNHDKIASLAARYPGWRPFHELAKIHFHRLRGDLVEACAVAERALSLVAPDGVVLVTAAVAWSQITNAYVDVLTDMERCDEARALGERAVATCAEHGIGQLSYEIGRGLAIAQAKLGDLAGAAARLDAIIAKQQAYGGHGLILGASYEARTRVAIWAGDSAAVEHYGQLAAHEYRHGRTTPLGARYERLIQEARVAGMNVLPQLDSFTSTYVGPTALGGVRAAIESSVAAALRHAEDAQSRARIALELLCEAHAATGGHLYVIRDDGLELAASFSAEPPNLDLNLFVAAFWQRHAADADVPTEFIPETGAAPAAVTVGWTDARGLAYHPILISTALAGDMLHVGVAALTLSEHPRRNPSATHLIASIGSYLASSGDVTGSKA